MRQARHCPHEQGRRAARSGGTCNNDGADGGQDLPIPDQAFNHQTLARFCIGGGGIAQIVSDDGQKGLGPPPVFGMAGHIECCNIGGCDAFALHFVHQAGKAVGQIKGRGTGGKTGVFVNQPRDQLRQFQPATQGRNGGWKARHGGVLAQFCNQANARQKPGTAFAEQINDAPPHAGCVDVKLHLSHRLRRLICQPRAQAAHQFCRKVRARRQRKNMGAGAFKHDRSPAVRRPLQGLAGCRHRTNCPHRRAHMRGGLRSSGPTFD